MFSLPPSVCGIRHCAALYIPLLLYLLLLYPALLNRLLLCPLPQVEPYQCAGAHAAAASHPYCKSSAAQCEQQQPSAAKVSALLLLLLLRPEPTLLLPHHQVLVLLLRLLHLPLLIAQPLLRQQALQHGQHRCLLSVRSCPASRATYCQVRHGAHHPDAPRTVLKQRSRLHLPICLMINLIKKYMSVPMSGCTIPSA